MAAPYPILNDVLNAARIRLNDAIVTPAGSPGGQVGGEVISDLAAFTQPAVNQAWQRFQQFLAGNGFSRLINTTTIANLPATTTADPGLMCYLGWDGYFDGTTLNATPVLPQDLVTPLRVKERLNGASGTGLEFTPMEYVIDGIPGLPKRNRSYNWTWDNDQIKFPGSTAAMDLEIRYQSFLPDFVDNSPLSATPWYLQPVPVMRSLDALAWYICSEFANARGDVDGAAFDTKAEAAAMKLVESEKQNDTLRSEWVVPDMPNATGATHYDVVSTMLNTARVRLNSVNKIAADILQVSSPFCQQYVNQAFRKLQEYMANKGCVRATEEIIITNIGAYASADFATQVWIDWTGYSNGLIIDTTRQLPENLIMPFQLWERQTGINAPFVPMSQWLNGLPSIWIQQPLNRLWEWRADRIYMLGATAATDLRIRYHKYEADFIQSTNGTVPWYLQPIPIARSTDALSLFVCAEVANARPDLALNPVLYQAAAENAADMIYNRDVRRIQQTTTTRRGLSGRLTSGYAYGY